MSKKYSRKKSPAREPETVPSVDVGRYCGTWYEIASFAPKEERKCVKIKAEYTLNSAGYVDVRNSCRRKGREKSIRAKAFVVPDTGGAKLTVRFFRFIKGDYWIVDLAEDYSWAVVSGPTMRSLWILSRTPYLDDSLYSSIVEKLRERGFDTERLVKTMQRE